MLGDDRGGRRLVSPQSISGHAGCEACFFRHVRVRARYGVLHFERKYLRTNMEILFNDDRCTLSKNWTRML